MLPAIMLGFAGVCIVITGRAVYVWRITRRVNCSPPSTIAPANVAVKAHRNLRPLTWLYRA